MHHLMQKCITKSVTGAECMWRWASRCVRQEETTYEAPSSLVGEKRRQPPPKPQSANAAFTVCHSEPVSRRAELIPSFDYYGYPVPFNVSFQACDMWLFACSLIASNNQREGLDIDMTHRQEWVSWLVLLMSGHFGDTCTFLGFDISDFIEMEVNGLLSKLKNSP